MSGDLTVGILLAFVAFALLLGTAAAPEKAELPLAALCLVACVAGFGFVVKASYALSATCHCGGC